MIDYIVNDESLADSALALIALGRTDAHAGDSLHHWVLDNDPGKNDPSLYSELAALALGMVNWSHIVRAIRPENNALADGMHMPVISLDTAASGNKPSHS